METINCTSVLLQIFASLSDMGIDEMQPTEHTLFLTRKLLWVIRKHKRLGATCSHTVVVEMGGKKEREKECVVELTQPFFDALERTEIMV